MTSPDMLTPKKATQPTGAIRVQVLSDFHAELNSDALPLPSDVATGADIVIIAGDMARAPDSVRYSAQLFPDAEVIIYVPGNHDHYLTAMTIDQGITVMRNAAVGHTSTSATKFVVLEDEACDVTVRGTAVRLIGATLWTDYNLFGRADIHRMRVARALNDYRAIRGRASNPIIAFLGSGSEFTTSENLSRHDASRAFLTTELAKPFDGPKIVITHHLPSMRSVAQRYRRDPVSAGFASRCDDLLAMGATLWVHGHTHDSCTYRDNSGTLVVCNPAGYPRRLGRENAKFDPKMVVDIRRGGPDRGWHAGHERKKMAAK
jgi:predicted phosphodiesterase